MITVAVVSVPVISGGPARCNEEIIRIGDAHRAWRARPWWYRVLFRWRRPAERLTITELLIYQTFRQAPIMEKLMERVLYGGPGRTIPAAHSPNVMPRGESIEDTIEWP